MKEKGLSSINLKKFNKSKVYQYIFKEKTVSKQQIVSDLQMGLSTVSQNLNLLEQEGLIERTGVFESTGGRKAQAIRIVPDKKVAVGVGLLKNMFHITIVDLYGNAPHTETIPLVYEDDSSYYLKVSESILSSIENNHFSADQILGVSFATQGLISSDHTHVTYAKIMNNPGMRLDSFSRHLPFPCHLEHDSPAAALLELWNHPEIDNALVFLLNRNIGGAVITHHTVHQGSSMHSGSIEHMCIHPDGPLCYCGNRGCLETYCSVNALEQAAGMSIKEFFPLLREKESPRLQAVWEDYLYHLAFAVRNLNLVFDAPIIISGYLAPYFTRDDIKYLVDKINSSSPFSVSEDQFLIGVHGQYTPAIGAALYYIEAFIQSI